MHEYIDIFFAPKDVWVNDGYEYTNERTYYAEVLVLHQGLHYAFCIIINNLSNAVGKVQVYSEFVSDAQKLIQYNCT